MSTNQKFISPFTPNTDQDKKKMLDAIGVTNVEELFLDIPEQNRNPSLNLPAPTSELELRREIEKMASQPKNTIPVIARIRSARFRHPIYTGDLMEAEVNLKENTGPAYFLTGRETASGKKILSIVFTAVMTKTFYWLKLLVF